MEAVHWVIQENQGHSESVRRIVQSLESDGHVPHLVWLTKSLEVPSILDLPEDSPVVCHGQGFIPRALHHPILKRGLFFNPENFRWSAFHAGWQEAVLSSDGRVMSLLEAKNLLGNGGKAFVRPDADSKIFDGGVYDAIGLADAAPETSIAPETAVVVATPRPVETEWRFFIVNREIVGCSEYRRWGHPSIDGAVPHTAIDLAADLASCWSPSDVYCLDLASSGDRIGVVEANCFNASRFYAAVIERVVRAVNAFVLSNQ